MTSFLEEQFSLKGEVAVVTGGTGELCSAMAQGFAQAGAKVAIVGRDAAKAEKRLAAIKDAGGDAIFIAADVTKKSDVERVAAETIKKFGRLMWMWPLIAVLSGLWAWCSATKASAPSAIAAALRAPEMPPMFSVSGCTMSTTR